MGCGHNPDVDLLRLRTSQVLEFPLLQNAQQLRLQLQGDIADFTEKQRTAVGQLQPAGLLCDRAGEGTPLVPKQFTLQQTARNGSDLAQRALPFPFMLTGRAHNFLYAAPSLDDTSASLKPSRRPELMCFSRPVCLT